MSCSSPFLFDPELTYGVEQTTIFTVSGTGTIPGYYLGPYSICLWGVNYSCCHTDTIWGWTFCDEWCGSWYQYDCTSTSIPIIPTFSLGGSANVPLYMDLTTTEVFTTTAPTTVNACTLTIQDFTLALKINGISYSVNISSPFTPVNFTNTNGAWSSSIAIATIASTYNDNGIDYNFTLGVSMLFCAVPTNGATWVNMQLDVNITCTYEGIGYSVNGSVVLPLVGVD